ncbi:MAG: OmpA family protein, partial [Pyrinomonadaceae bacterium]|nr:OmpA family protein [Sphingobacteriaceae bacterium]
SVIFNVGGAQKLLKSWSVALTDEKGAVLNYGPYTRDQESVTGKSILGNNPTGNYKVVMTGITNSGLPVTKEGNINLIRQDESVDKGYRYSILFDFDKSKSIASYDKFLRDIVTPSITNGSTVIIHGHTDLIGEEEYNYKLSQSRAQQTQKILEGAISNAGKNDVKFETFGFGEDLSRSPFENSRPEERFYNRTVIIDIIPGK